MVAKLSHFMSNSKLITKRALLKIAHGFKAMRNLKIQRNQESTLLLHATLSMIKTMLSMIQDILEPLKYRSVLSLAIRLQLQILEKSAGIKSELLGQGITLQNSNGNSSKMIDLLKKGKVGIR